jgi:hypothetical protein
LFDVSVYDMWDGHDTPASCMKIRAGKPGKTTQSATGDLNQGFTYHRRPAQCQHPSGFRGGKINRFGGWFQTGRERGIPRRPGRFGRPSSPPFGTNVTPFVKPGAISF